MEAVFYPKEKLYELVSKHGDPPYLKRQDIYVYFNNDFESSAVENAGTLLAIPKRK
jgi:uncharacterized protein YecE (DUF72 family)